MCIYNNIIDKIVKIRAVLIEIWGSVPRVTILEVVKIKIKFIIWVKIRIKVIYRNRNSSCKKALNFLAVLTIKVILEQTIIIIIIKKKIVLKILRKMKVTKILIIINLWAVLTRLLIIPVFTLYSKEFSTILRQFLEFLVNKLGSEISRIWKFWRLISKMEIMGNFWIF